MKKIVLSMLLGGLLLTSCGNNNDNLKIMTPIGAPAIAVYKYANSKNWEPQDQATNIAKAFTASPSAQKDILIFDSISGLKQIAGPNKAPYKLAKVITNGNLYMVSLNGKTADDEIAKSDKIVSFGQDLVPDIAIKALYEELVPQIEYVNSAADAASIVCSGKKEGQDVDYVIGAMPSIWSMMNRSSCPTYGKVKIVKNIQEDMEQITGSRGIPQAGVFVLNSTYESRKKDVDKFLDTIEKSIDEVKSNPTKVYDELLKTLDEETISKKFGFTKASLEACFAYGANLIGLTNEDIDINAFLSSLDMETIDEQYFLK